jgi:hypothetical protein
MGDVGLDGTARVGGQLVPPEAVGDALRRNDVASGEDQDGEDSPLTATAEVHLHVAVAGVEPAEDPDPKPASSRHPASQARR